MLHHTIPFIWDGHRSKDQIDRYSTPSFLATCQICFRACVRALYQFRIISSKWCSFPQSWYRRRVELLAGRKHLRRDKEKSTPVRPLAQPILMKRKPSVVVNSITSPPCAHYHSPSTSLAPPHNPHQHTILVFGWWRSSRCGVWLVIWWLLVDVLRLLKFNAWLLPLTIVSIITVERVSRVLTIDWWWRLVRWSGASLIVLRSVMTERSFASCPACAVTWRETGAATAARVEAPMRKLVGWFLGWREIRGEVERERLILTRNRRRRWGRRWLWRRGRPSDPSCPRCCYMCHCCWTRWNNIRWTDCTVCED